MPVRAPARCPPKCLFLLRNLHTPVTVCSDEVQNREWRLPDSLDNNFQEEKCIKEIKNGPTTD